MSNQTDKNVGENSIARALKVIAWLTFSAGGVILIFIFIEEPYEAYWALLALASSIIIGILYLGFAEIVTLLQKIVDHNKKMIALPLSTATKLEPEQYSDLPEL